ncbi:Hypothetical predicted protein [Olea europaea subsp. europaea]|uniref:Uncharacterized protein n=1 Tax=Olea europaea subsp. europaea TaxID=158383 RepID=A0A8S0RIE9_OLEEU|nr:Hypothetical predicted protein [Olea europaea subsp. europaea]
MYQHLEMKCKLDPIHIKATASKDLKFSLHDLNSQRKMSLEIGTSDIERRTLLDYRLDKGILWSVILNARRHMPRTNFPINIEGFASFCILKRSVENRDQWTFYCNEMKLKYTLNELMPAKPLPLSKPLFHSTIEEYFSSSRRIEKDEKMPATSALRLDKEGESQKEYIRA